MNENYTDQEIADFRDWLKARLPAAETAAPQPSEALLDAAWQAAQAHQKYLLDAGLYRRVILPLAASEEDARQKPTRFKDPHGQWSLTRETIPQDPQWEVLKFECHPDSIELYRGRAVAVTIGEAVFQLGTVNRRGVAEAYIPAGLDLQQAIEVRVLPL